MYCCLIWYHMYQICCKLFKVTCHTTLCVYTEIWVKPESVIPRKNELKVMHKQMIKKNPAEWVYTAK